jgi:hypothetical protein
MIIRWDATPFEQACIWSGGFFGWIALGYGYFVAIGLVRW